MQFGSIGSQAAIDYANNAPSAMKPEATQEAASVLTLRKAIDTEQQLDLQLISNITGLGASST